MPPWEIPQVQREPNIPPEKEIQRELFDITEAEVIQGLKETPDLENCEIYKRWRNHIEAGSQNPSTALENILRDARVRLEAGLREAAGAAYEEALETADGFGDTGVASEIEETMRRNGLA